MISKVHLRDLVKLNNLTEPTNWLTSLVVNLPNNRHRVQYLANPQMN